MGVEAVSEAAGPALEGEVEGFGKHETIPVSQETPETLKMNPLKKH
jgi:hypothetical protein